MIIVDNMEHTAIVQLAAEHGLQLQEGMTFNEMGLDFRVAFATDASGNRWVLRIPRRAGLDAQIGRESQILALVKRHLPVAVPDWRVCSPHLVAYPLLGDKPALTFDHETYAVTWHIDREGTAFVQSLAGILVCLHGIPVREAEVAGIPAATLHEARVAMQDKLDRVKRELDLPALAEARWQGWLDDDRLWPDFSAFIHGDLFAGHILAESTGTITGIIDWSEGQVGDPSADFAGHAAVFGEEGLRELIRAYEQAGGKTWPYLYDQAMARQGATPLAYAHFALTVGSDTHLEAAKAQLASLA